MKKEKDKKSYYVDDQVDREGKDPIVKKDKLHNGRV